MPRPCAARGTEARGGDDGRGKAAGGREVHRKSIGLLTTPSQLSAHHCLHSGIWPDPWVCIILGMPEYDIPTRFVLVHADKLCRLPSTLLS